MSTSTQLLHLISPQLSFWGGYFRFQSKNQPQKCKKHSILHTFQANGNLTSPPPRSPSYATVVKSVGNCTLLLHQQHFEN